MWIAKSASIHPSPPFEGKACRIEFFCIQLHLTKRLTCLALPCWRFSLSPRSSDRTKTLLLIVDYGIVWASRTGYHGHLPRRQYGPLRWDEEAWGPWMESWSRVQISKQHWYVTRARCCQWEECNVCHAPSASSIQSVKGYRAQKDHRGKRQGIKFQYLHDIVSVINIISLPYPYIMQESANLEYREPA